MGSFAGKCEIVKEKEDQQSSAVYSERTILPHSGLSTVEDKDLEHPVLKLGYKGSLEDDINQLFESISIRTSGMVPSYEVGASTSRNTRPLGRNALKSPVNPGAQQSTIITTAESATLKQALRDLCISKASETAAMKRVPKTSGSPGVSEAGRLKNLYGSVLVESGSGVTLANEEGEAVLVDLLGESKNHSPERISQQLHALKITSTSQSSSQMSPKFAVQTNRYNDATMLQQHGVDSLSKSVGYQESKTEMFRKDDDLYAYLESHLNAEDEALGLDHKNFASSSRSGIETVVGLKSVRRVRLLYANTSTSTIVNGRRVPKLTRTVARAAKPATRNKVPVKKKAKQCTNPANVYDEVDGYYNPITKQLLCHRCHSALKNASTEEAYENCLVSSTNYHATHSYELGSDDLNPGIKYPSLEETTQDFCSSSYENSNGINIGASNNQDTVKGPLDVNANTITSSTETNHVSLASPFVDDDADADPPLGFRYGPKNTNRVSEEISLSLPSGKEVDRKASFFMSDQNVEIGSFSERSVVMNPDSPPDEPDIDETINEEDKEKQKGRDNNDEFFQSSNDIIGGNSISSSMSEGEESNGSRSSFSNRPHMLKDMRWQAIQHIKMQYGSIGLRHFNLLKKLGCGDIGTVYLAELTGTNYLFAIKVMDNEFLARRNKMPRAQTERDILKMLDHPFLPTLYSHFTSDNLACLVMECCPGGDLHVLRQKQPGRCFSEPAARFYVAEVLLALEYLHMLGVIYRDLKPENILVREDGHIMVTDFDLSLRCTVSPTLLSSSSPLHGDAVRNSGQATQSSCIEPWCIQPSLRVSCFRPRLLRGTKKGKKRMRKVKKSDLMARFRSLPQLVAEPSDARSNSFVGTHEYLAPEIIKGEGHGAAVDWWTFGIFLYELLYGRTPFKGSTNEETLGNVVLQNLKFPDNPNVSTQARDLIRGLLVKEPENRLGTEKGAAEIKRHPFFEGLNWALIRCAIPPELPEFYEYGAPNHESKEDYLECKANGEHLEFELF